MIDFREYIKPCLIEFFHQFEDVCLLCQQQRFHDASMLLLACLQEHLNGECQQNLLYLQYRTEVYLKEFSRIQDMDIWSCSDYTYNIAKCIRNGENPYLFLTDKTKSLHEASHSL